MRMLVVELELELNLDLGLGLGLDPSLGHELLILVCRSGSSRPS